MKKVFIVVCFLFAFVIGKSQISYTPMTASGYQFKYIKVDSGFAVPLVDTSVRRGINRPGLVVCRPQDSALYVYNGANWELLGANTAGIIAQLNEKVDSVTTSGNFIYYWKEGVSYGEELTGFTLQQVLDNGGAFDKANIINSNGNTLEINNLESLSLDSNSYTFAYFGKDGNMTITDIRDNTQILQFENTSSYFSVSHQNGINFFNVNKEDTILTIHNSFTGDVRDTVAYLSDVRANAGALINLGNSNLTQTDPTRTYDGDGGELSFSNLGKFKVSASDSVVVNSELLRVIASDSVSVKSSYTNVATDSVLVTSPTVKIVATDSIYGSTNRLRFDIADGGTVQIGVNALSNGFESVAIGTNVISSGANSFAIGYNNTQAVGDFSVALGTQSVANGNSSFALQEGATSNGELSIAFANSTANGDNSFASVNGVSDGNNSFASVSGFARNEKSIAIGDNSISNEANMIALGTYNDTTVTNTAFVVGNGTGTRSNALQLLKTGALYLPYYTNTDTNKVLSANASGLLEWRTKGAGGSVAFVSDTLRAASTSGVNIKNSLGNTAAIFGASNTTTTELLGRVKINKDSVDIVSDKKWALVIDTANNEIDRRDLDSLYNDESIDLFSFYGSTIRSSTIPLWAYNTAQIFTESRVYFQPQRIKKGTYSGFKFGVSTQGNYVGDAANQIGIYSYSGGTLTLIDSTTRDTELWKGAANSISTKALNSPLVIPRDGNYVIGFLYNYSSQTTAPRILALIPTILPYTNLYSNSAGFKYINSQNVLPSSVAMSSMNGETGSIMLIGLY